MVLLGLVLLNRWRDWTLRETGSPPRQTNRKCVSTRIKVKKKSDSLRSIFDFKRCRSVCSPILNQHYQTEKTTTIWQTDVWTAVRWSEADSWVRHQRDWSQFSLTIKNHPSYWNTTAPELICLPLRILATAATLACVAFSHAVLTAVLPAGGP